MHFFGNYFVTPFGYMGIVYVMMALLVVRDFSMYVRIFLGAYCDLLDEEYRKSLIQASY